MGLINKISNRILGKDKNAQADKIIKQATLRRCHFETMEERKVLSADPVVAGVTYLEGDEGGDGLPDHFEVTYEGGSDTTELTQFVISGDQDLSGTLNDGDMFFDADAASPGTAEFHGFQFDAANSSGVSQSDINSATVSADGLTLTVEVDNFQAGDVLAFTIDVDEVEGRRNDRIASGVEFESSLFTATFADDHFTFEGLDVSVDTTLIDGFVQNQNEGLFYDEYDDLLVEGADISGGVLELSRDNQLGLEDRTAGAVDAYELVEKPVAISGTVFHDEDLDCVHDEGSDDGIAGVTINLQALNETTGQYETVASTVTDANGDYEFGLDLGLPPGTYQVVQIQPDGFLDTGAIAGSEGGTVLNDANGNGNIISQIELPLGDTVSTDNDFKEVRPASVGGYVSVGTPGQTKLSPDDPNFRPIEGVTIQLFDDAGELVQETQTDANGHYEFTQLPPGTYSILEIQPDGFIDGAEEQGTVDGFVNGSNTNDRFTNVVLGSGDEGVDFNFCEVEPASIKGTVYHDRNDNGVQDSGEEGIEGVVIQLFDVDGNVVQETTTDANGEYCFEGLPPGEYKIREAQPTGFDDGKDAIGTVDGQTNGEHETNDEFCVILLNGGDEGIEYNFGELKLAEISGFVHVDNDGDCEFGTSASDRPLAGVTLELLDAEGNVIATTTTAADGSYSFGGLRPGDYGIRQVQPDDFFTGGERVGDGGGDASENLIQNISIESGQKLTEYNFCEHEAAEIHGRVWEDGPAFETDDGTLPTDYRDQRDSVYQAGVDTPIEGVRIELYYFIDPTVGAEGSIAPRPVLISEVMAEDYPYIDASDPNSVVYALTDAQGEYWFTGLSAGNYLVLETQPDGFEDANDVVGTTTGFTINSDSEADTAIAPLTNTFSNVQLQDVVAGIQVNNGGISTLNNFTEVSVVIAPPEETPPFINPLTPTPPRVPGNPITPGAGITGHSGLFGSEPSAFTQFVGTARGGSFQQQQTPVAEDPYTWHLSVINGGQPRAFDGDGAADSIWHQAGHIDSTDWNRYDMTEAVWTYTSMDDESNISVKAEKSTFGMLGGTPLAGDFDGDGIDEIAVFKDGYWLIDINNNGRWDQEDLFAKLGDAEDRPVVGDWDGDGKDDIGIFGPMWERDEEAIEQEPGLPNPDNDLVTRPKNVPPADDDAANGARVMKLSSYGQDRADVVDHVFGIEEGTIVPVTGDWNGNGIRSIGKFVDGHWEVDINGDGRFDHEDQTFDFGRAGDTPLVGDFNGDGIEEIAVYRSGTWLIDTDGNRELTATDKTFELGGAADKPVVGDFNGDGVDEPGLYTENPTTDLQL